MKQWYEFYSTQEALEKIHQLGGEISESQIAPSSGAKFPVIFSFVPWRYHIEILSKCKSIDEALFYVKMTVQEGWSRNAFAGHLSAATGYDVA